MEKLVDSGLLAGVIDVTTTEVADEIVGGVLSAGPDRLDAFARTARAVRRLVRRARHGQLRRLDTVPERFSGRTLYAHNPHGHADAHDRRTNAARSAGSSPPSSTRCAGPVRFLIPEGGVSALDAPGQPFHDPEADQALFAAIEASFRAGPTAQLMRLPLHINDPAFADALVAAWREVARARGRTRAHPLKPRDDHAPHRPRRAPRAASATRSPRGEPIVGGGAGTGLSAKCEEAGGIDLIVIYNSGRYRMAGRGSLAGLLAYGNANEIVVRDGARGAAGGASTRRCWPASTAPTRS